MLRLIVCFHPVFRHLIFFHALLNLRARRRHYPAQKVREVLVFLAVGFVAHAVIIARSERKSPMSVQVMQGWFLICPKCSRKTVLPRQSRIGTYEGLQHQPKGKWPLAYLCPGCGQLSAVEHTAVRFDAVAGPNLVLGRQALWWIDCECGHKNCAGTFSLCYNHLEIETPAQVCEIVANISPAVECGTGDHRFEFQPAMMHAEKMGS